MGFFYNFNMDNILQERVPGRKKTLQTDTLGPALPKAL
jgi:hypothetical protein